MAAPVTTARVAPVGIKLKDGHGTTIAFAADPNISFWEIGTQPPGMDGGDAIDHTTHHNVAYRTVTARQLITMTENSVRVFYDPDVFNQIWALINVEGSITVTFPDGSTLDYFGFLRTFEPDEVVEGEAPEASITITPTNVDPVNNVEAAPVLTSVAGT